ncbi:MAG: phosphatidate cytidylyltransferase [Planctomycetes bacterium]|nr:phosphatidate cytidylyltransferase [Planctomycetota bacterium]
MTKTRAQRIMQRTVVGVGLSLALAGLLYITSLSFGPRFLLAAATLVAGLGGVEAVRMGLFGSRVRSVSLWIPALAVGALWFLELDSTFSEGRSMDLRTRYWGALALSPWLAGAAFLVAHRLNRGSDSHAGAPGSPLARILAFACITSALACLYPVRMFGGTSALVALVLLSKIGDIFGYYCGNMWGKTHPFPRLSPGKTTEGCLGSFAAGTVAGILCQLYGLLPGGEMASLPGVWAGALAGASVNLASQAGDLFESSWKRRTSVKDSGTWFGPSGGVLDLVDSLLVSAPVAALTWPGLFGWAFGA